MYVSETVHYQLGTKEGIQEFAKLVPVGGHLVHIKDEHSGNLEAYTVALFHQMKCLDILRERLISRKDDARIGLTQHCLNYLRQSIICRPNLHLESTKDRMGLASKGYDAVCRDWTQVYAAAAESNHRAGANGTS
ncbi:hypothetical protein C8J56DRAFT_1043398 [Mycena floridula]|nr:hypothetical protein C8J56DRAFT_1043398 [Mycena floridula]